VGVGPFVVLMTSVSIWWMSTKPPVRAPTPNRQPPWGFQAGIGWLEKTVAALMPLLCVTVSCPDEFTLTVTGQKIFESPGSRSVRSGLKATSVLL
jgi:hypothetical protein